MTIRWSKISLAQYAELETLRRFQATDKLQQDISCLSIITGISEDKISDMKAKRFDRMRQKMFRMLSQEPINRKRIFWIRLRRFVAVNDMDDYTGSHLESISILKVTPENMHEKAAEVLASLIEEKTPFRRQLSFKSRVELLKSKCPVSIALPIIKHFDSGLKEIIVTYEPQKKTLPDIDQPLTPDFKKTQSLYDHWGFFHTFFELSGRKRDKMDYWRKQSIPYIFNSLAHRSDLLDQQEIDRLTNKK